MGFFCLTPATLSAVVSLYQMGVQLQMYNDLKERLYDCADDSMELAEEIFEKRKTLLNSLADIYEKLCGVPERERCEEAAMCALEYSVMSQGSELLQNSLNTLDCYQVGAGREMVRSALMLMAAGAVNAKVDACNIENSLDDARQVLQTGAVVSGPSQGNEYYGLSSAYQGVGAQLAAQMGAQAASFNASAQAFGFSVGTIFKQYQKSREPAPVETTPETEVLFPLPANQPAPDPYGGYA